MADNKPETIDAYIENFPEQAQQAMQHIRELVHNIVPEATETISYAMPTFKLQGHYLVYFAAFKNHIGFYPAPVNEQSFQQDLAGYKTGRGSVQFPLSQPMPTDLIIKMIQFRLNENLRKTKSESL